MAPKKTATATTQKRHRRNQTSPRPPGVCECLITHIIFVTCCQERLNVTNIMSVIRHLLSSSMLCVQICSVALDGPSQTQINPPSTGFGARAGAGRESRLLIRRPRPAPAPAPKPYVWLVQRVCSAALDGQKTSVLPALDVRRIRLLLGRRPLRAVQRPLVPGRPSASSSNLQPPGRPGLSSGLGRPGSSRSDRAVAAGASNHLLTRVVLRPPRIVFFFSLRHKPESLPLPPKFSPKRLPKGAAKKRAKTPAIYDRISVTYMAPELPTPFWPDDGRRRP
jgi:hypothetical protein